jgi:hypothetical protein
MWMMEIAEPLITGTSDGMGRRLSAIPVFRKQRLDFSSGLIERGTESASRV